MIKEKNIKTKIINRIDKFSDKKLALIWSYLDKIEKDSILSYAGIFADEDMSEFTTGLSKRRKKAYSIRKK